MLSLIKKEFKLNPFFLIPNKKNWFSFIVFFVLLSGLIALEVYIFHTLYQRFNEYENGAFAFSNLFLIIIAFISLFIALIYTQRIYFNQLDMFLIINKPLDYVKILLSKFLYALLVNYLSSLVFTLPLFILLATYGEVFDFFTFFIGLFFPLFLSLFNLGVALILAVPLQYAYKFLKQFPLLQLLVVAIFLGLFCYGYSLVLNLFIDLINNNSLGTLFSVDSLEKMTHLSTHFYPYSLLTNGFVNYHYGLAFTFFLLMSLLLILGGITLVGLFYLKLNQFSFVLEHRKRLDYPLLTPLRAIIKKEFILLFKENNTTYSFTALLILEPVLTYLVINAINVALLRGNLAIYLGVMPYLLNNIDLLIALLFSSVISLNAINIYQSEKKAIRVMKFIPYSLYKHIYIKLLIPYFVSAIATLIAFIILVATSLIGVDTFLMGLLFALVLNFILMVLLMRAQLRNDKYKRVNNSLPSFISFLVPLVMVALNILLGAFLNLKNIYTYLIDLIIIALPLSYVIYYLVKRFKDDVYALEVIN